MEQRGKSRRPGKTGRSGVRLFFIALFCLGQTALAVAATNPLQGQFDAAAPGGVITLAPGQTIDFSHTADAIVVAKPGLTVRGATGGFAAQIGDLSGSVSAQKDGLTPGSFQTLLNDWKSGLAPYGNLSGITGAGTVRNITGLSGADNDKNKWLSTPYATNQSGANGISLENLYLGNVQVEYTGNSFVNGLIGSNHYAGSETTMGDIAGNVFNNIGVTLESDNVNHYLAGGGVLGIRSTDGTASINAVSGNIFDGIRILTTNDDGDPASTDYPDIAGAYLEGGGIIGVNGVSSPDMDQGHASLDVLSGNFFTNIQVGSNDVLLGGGLVGINNNSKFSGDSTYAKLGTVSGNVFGSGADGDISVMVNKSASGSSLRGGGVIGVNGLSSAAAELTALENNAFAGIKVATSGYIRGGGIVGLQTNDALTLSGGNPTDPDLRPAQATLGSASGNLFLNQTVTALGYMEGGGVIGLRSNMGVGELGALTGNIFRNITVSTGEAETLSGGGVVGISANTQALMGEGGGIKNNVFDGVTVSVGKWDAYDPSFFIGNYLNGGGIIGIHARDFNTAQFNWASMQEIERNSFTNSNVTAMSLNGGGIVGVNAGGAPDSAQFVAGLSALGRVTNNIFDRLEITTVNGGDGSGHLEGGGVIGVWNKDSTINSIGDNANYGVSAIDEVDNNSFTNITVNAGSYLQGGGIIGIRGSALEQMGELTRNIFADNTITAGEYIDGGGVIGVTSRDGTSPFAGIQLIGESVFAGNKVSAASDVFGGIVYSYGLTNVDGAGMTIRDSQFSGNTFESGSGIVYGAVTVDTGADPMPGNTNTLTLTATPGNSVVFMNNKITDKVGDVFTSNAWDSPRLPSERTNSLYFGIIANPDPPIGVEPLDPSAWSPELIVNPQAGGVVALYDPIWVNQADPATGDDSVTGDTSDYSFDMNVRGGGDFIWGGTNVFTLDTASAGDNGTSGTVTLEAGSATTLLDGSSATTFVSGAPISGSHVSTMILDAPNFKFALQNGATLNVEGHNRLDLSGDAFTSTGSLAGAGDLRGATVADLNGDLHFNLHNTQAYSQGEVPGDAGHPLPDNDERLSAPYTPLLTINTPDGGQGKVSLAGSTVYLNDFEAGPKLQPGDRFYLVELDNGLEGDPGNNVFTGDNPSNDTASARQGMLTRYTFAIDKNLENLGNEEDTRFLVARLKSAEPAPEFDSPNTGRITGVTVLQRVSDRLPDLEFFGPAFPAEPYLLVDPCDPDMERKRRENQRDYSKWRWAGFGDVKGSWYRADTSGSGYADIKAVHYLGGIAGGRQLDDGRIQAGLFADASHANYDTRNRVSLPEGSATLHGQGDIDTVGGGAFLRRNWNNGFSVDLMLRGGKLENEFSSRDIVTNGIPAHYDLDTTYWGAGLGLNYEWQYEKNTFDVYGRYSWLRENGDNVRLSTGETVEFKPLDSHRLTAGARLTRQTDLNLAWYVGGAYEYEFSGSSRAEERSNGGDNMYFDGVGLRGGAGVGEVGLILNPLDHLSVTLGLEGYVGQRQGGSALASVVWRF